MTNKDFVSVYWLDTSDPPFPTLVKRDVHVEDLEKDQGSYYPEYFYSFTDAKKGLIKYLKDRKEHWQVMLKWARELKKSEVE